MIKAVLFDLDGTLLNRDESVKKFIDNQYERLNKWLHHIPKEKYIAKFIELDNHGYVWKDKVYQQLTEEFGVTEVSWEWLLRDYVEQFKHHCVPFPNLVKMLEELKREQFSLGIITNGFGQFQMDNIRALGIEHYFETILVSEWEGIKKPDPQLFTRALNQLHVTASESVFVGDHPANDVQAAKYVGMKSIWKKDFQWAHVNADFIITDLADVCLIVDQLNKDSIR